MKEKINRNSIPNTITQALEILEYFDYLYSLEMSESAAQFVELFSQPKDLTIQNIIAGMKKFIELANLNHEERQTFFGNKFAGLHYSPDLLDLWGRHINRTPTDINISLPLFAPHEWKRFHTEESTSIAYFYQGADSATALDRLLQGPTIIDCGMFCQLSMLFGIRYVLGNKKFNQMFGSAEPLILTQILYDNAPEKPIWFKNPFYDFFTVDSEFDRNSFSLTLIPNTPYYLLKHPGGCYAGMNCVVIDDKYFCFDPSLNHRAGLKKMEITEHLLANFNASADVHDQKKLEQYRKYNPEMLHPSLKVTFHDLISIANAFATKIISLEEQITSTETIKSDGSLHFNFSQFILKVKALESSEVTHKTANPTNFPLATRSSPLHTKPPLRVVNLRGIDITRSIVNEQNRYEFLLDLDEFSDEELSVLQETIKGEHGMKSGACVETGMYCEYIESIIIEGREAFERLYTLFSDKISAMDKLSNFEHTSNT